MDLSTIIFIVGLLGAVLGVKKPWMGGIAGLLISPLLFYFYISPDLTALTIVTLVCFLIGLASGFPLGNGIIKPSFWSAAELV